MLKISFQNLWRRKSRTSLSLAGIIIGVASIIALVSVVDGLSQNILGSVGQIQGIMVFQKGGAGPFYSVMDEDYRNDLESIQGVKTASPVVMELAKSIDGEDLGISGDNLLGGMVRLIGTEFAGDTDKVSGVSGEVTKGRSLKRGEKGKVIIGEVIEEDYKKFLGGTIKIDGERFDIVGVYDAGSAMINSAILMDIDDLRDLTGFPGDKVAYFSVELVNPEDAERATKLIEFKFPDELNAISSSQFGEALAGVLDSARLLVLAVAGLSALVAGVGIINTMLMSVMERFKEIGALKATGWTDANIMRVIIYESVFLGAIGGIIGMGVGWWGALVLGEIVGFPVLVSPLLLGEAFSFALLISLAAGIYPAWMASRVDPIEVLRAE